MKKRYVYKTMAVCFGAFMIVYAGFIATHHQSVENENISIKKINSLTVGISGQYNKQHYARVEINIKDDITLPDGKIIGVKFNGDMLTLQPADPSGNRGSSHLKIKPGLYQIKWYVKKNKYAYPRKVKHVKQLRVDQNTLWIHIVIEGNKININ